MANKVDEIVNALPIFTETFDKSKLNYQFGAIRFYAATGGGEGHVIVSQPPLSLDGIKKLLQLPKSGDEHLIDAILEGIPKLKTRPEAKVALVILTDEPSTTVQKSNIGELKFNAFRYFNAAGASEKLGEVHKPETHLIPLVIQVALGKRKHINIFGTDYPTKDGTCIRDYIHVLDLAQAHILGLENLEKHPNGKYNLGNGEGFSVLEVVETVSKISGRDIPIVEASRRKGDPAVLVASSELAKQELGWKPKYDSLEEIIWTAWEWHIKKLPTLPTIRRKGLGKGIWERDLGKGLGKKIFFSWFFPRSLSQIPFPGPFPRSLSQVSFFIIGNVGTFFIASSFSPK